MRKSLLFISDLERLGKTPQEIFQYYQTQISSGINVDILAWNELGVCYRRSIGVEPNIEKAMQCYQYCAEKGYAIACKNLASVYEEKKEWRIALKWMLAASVNDPENQNYQFKLAEIFEGQRYEGQCIDIGKSIKYYQKALHNGHEDSLLSFWNLIRKQSTLLS